jgi:hypothetical protein
LFLARTIRREEPKRLTGYLANSSRVPLFRIAFEPSGSTAAVPIAAGRDAANIATSLTIKPVAEDSMAASNLTELSLLAA